MGHTNYMRNKPEFTDEQWAAFTADVKELVKNSEVPLYGWDGTRRPEFTAKRVAFNGSAADGEDCETAMVKREAVEFSFCKTRGLPYDSAVVELFKLVRKHLPSTVLSSDGGKEVFG